MHRNSSKMISIIIPVYNNREGLNRTLEALTNQNLKLSSFEVIVVDNGSTDNPEEIINKYQEKLDLIFLEEVKFLNSPYSARNRGIEKSNGRYIVFLDATCAPHSDCLSEGIKKMKDSQADLVGGNVIFELKRSDSLGAIYDALNNIRMKESIENRNAAKTGILFVKRKVFSKAGMFPEGLRSGGDVRWSYKTTTLGFNLVYCEKAIVYIKPRGFRKLARKQYRVGRGQPRMWVESSTLWAGFTKKILLGWLPPNPIILYRRIAESEMTFIKQHFIQLYFIGWIMRIVNAFGSLKGLIQLVEVKK